MADFNRKKLQVFVSSTFSDLIPERQAAVEAILTAGHIPAGMELFTAGDESQMEVIKQWIDESDVYLLILGGRYGSLEPKTGKSYTELEYEYAISKAKPFFACVIKDEAIETRVKAKGTPVIEMDNQQKLKEFSSKVLTKMCKFWEDLKDIKITIAETLAAFAKREGLAGWVRSTTQSNLPALTDEPARLSKENAQLRALVADTDKEERINGLTFSELKGILEQHGAVDLLLTSKRALSTTGLSAPDEGRPASVDELCLRGLLTRKDTSFSPLYHLTESGRTFLNKLEAQQLAPKSAPPAAPAEAAP